MGSFQVSGSTINIGCSGIGDAAGGDNCYWTPWSCETMECSHGYFITGIDVGTELNRQDCYSGNPTMKRAPIPTFTPTVVLTTSFNDPDRNLSSKRLKC